MPLKEKYTGRYLTVVKSFSSLKVLISMLGTSVFLLIFTQGFSSEPGTEKVYTSGDATIIYSVNNSNSVVITEGKITATEGQTIRLLPGTHIKNGEHLTINIGSKECQDAVAIEVARENEVKLHAYVSKRRKEALLTETTEEILWIFNYSPLPEKSSSVSQQNIQLTASNGNTSVSFSTPVNLLLKKNTSYNIHNLEVLAPLSIYTPVYSWGERAENIKVMLC